MENGLDIILAANSEEISLLMMLGNLRVEGRFAGMKVCHSGGGVPIRYP